MGDAVDAVALRVCEGESLFLSTAAFGIYALWSRKKSRVCGEGPCMRFDKRIVASAYRLVARRLFCIGVHLPVVASFLPPRYFENVRQAVLWRVTRLSNDELSGEEEAVMSVVHSLMSLLEVIQPNSSVSMYDYHAPGCR